MLEKQCSNYNVIKIHKLYYTIYHFTYTNSRWYFILSYIGYLHYIKSILKSMLILLREKHQCLFPWKFLKSKNSMKGFIFLKKEGLLATFYYVCYGREICRVETNLESNCVIYRGQVSFWFWTPLARWQIFNHSFIFQRICTIVEVRFTMYPPICKLIVHLY